MPMRILSIALNTYREAVRARVLYGLLALALATTAYSVVLGAMSLHQEKRVIADVSAASISLYSVLVAIVLGATSLHREIELKTLFPILTRRLVRHEFVLGKFFGIGLTMAVFVLLDGGTALALLANEAGRSPGVVLGTVAGFGVTLGLALYRFERIRVFVLIPFAIAYFAAMVVLAAPAGGERTLVVAQCGLALFEVAIVTAITVFFSSFSTPFLTAIFTLAIFVFGRSAETLGNLPAKTVGVLAKQIGYVVSKVVPNLHLYVPERALLLGEVDGVPIGPYVAKAGLNAAFYSALLVVLACAVFRKRDLQ
ncbi:MAG: hypothetical protein IPK71_23220 [Myxococcales bacterium]|nr:hypothetical protein [Myxococcales bacterium]MBL9108009.1 hypothetical protein [Myxococcales bacterium]